MKKIHLYLRIGLGSEKEHLTKILEHKNLCRFNSEKFKLNKLKWIIFEKELYTIILALQNFKYYLHPSFLLLE